MPYLFRLCRFPVSTRSWTSDTRWTNESQGEIGLSLGAHIDSLHTELEQERESGNVLRQRNRLRSAVRRCCLPSERLAEQCHLLIAIFSSGSPDHPSEFSLDKGIVDTSLFSFREHAFGSEHENKTTDVVSSPHPVFWHFYSRLEVFTRTCVSVSSFFSHSTHSIDLFLIHFFVSKWNERRNEICHASFQY